MNVLNKVVIQNGHLELFALAVGSLEEIYNLELEDPIEAELLSQLRESNGLIQSTTGATKSETPNQSAMVEDENVTTALCILPVIG